MPLKKMPSHKFKPGNPGMIPSTIYTTAKGKFLVRRDWEWTCKRDSLGRRIRGTDRPVKLHGVVVSRLDRSHPRSYPPGTPISKAVEDYEDKVKGKAPQR
jgi:hypothetical protein